MKWFKSIIKKPATAVLLIASVLTLLGVVAKGFFDLRNTSLPIHATQTAEAALVHQTPVNTPDTSSGDSISIGGDVSDSTIIQSEGGDVITGDVINYEEPKDTHIDAARPILNDSQQIEAINADGERVWLYEVDGRIAVYDVFDVNTDGEKELIIGIRAKDDTSNTDTGKIIVINQNKERIAEFNLYDPR
jgi:hypothetical protein